MNNRDSSLGTLTRHQTQRHLNQFWLRAKGDFLFSKASNRSSGQSCLPVSEHRGLYSRKATETWSLSIYFRVVGWLRIRVATPTLLTYLNGVTLNKSKAQWLLYVLYCTTGFNIPQFYVLPTQCIYVFCVGLRTKRDYFPIHHKLAGFYNREGKCLLRGTGWVYNIQVRIPQVLNTHPHIHVPPFRKTFQKSNAVS